jgi:hypothetical protein
MWKGFSSASFFHVQISKQIQIAFSAHGIGDGLPGAIAAAAAVVPKANECYNDNNYIVLMSLLLSLDLLLFPKLLNSSSSGCLSGCHPSSPCTLSDCIKNLVFWTCLRTPMPSFELSINSPIAIFRQIWLNHIMVDRHFSYITNLFFSFKMFFFKRGVTLPANNIQSL